MLATFVQMKDDVVRKLGISTTTAFYTDDIISDWVIQATRFATAYKKWPFTEGRTSTTYTGSEELLFEGYKADSIRMLTVGGKRFQKLNYEDYLILKEQEPSSSEKVYSNFGRLVIVNPNTGVSGTLTAYGQFMPADFDPTDDAATTVFSGGDEEGNEAIVEEALAYAHTRERDENKVKFHHERATQILDTLWNKTQAEKFTEQTSRARGGMFTRINVLRGGVTDDLIRRDQFPFS